MSFLLIVSSVLFVNRIQSTPELLFVLKIYLPSFFLQGITASEDLQEGLCLHLCSSVHVVKVSDEIIRGVFTCSLSDAEACVTAGYATKEVSSYYL